MLLAITNQNWYDTENSTIRFDSGLSEKVVRDISKIKDEPEWMTGNWS